MNWKSVARPFSALLSRRASSPELKAQIEAVSTKRRSKICTCRSVRSAGPKRRSLAKRGSSHWRSTSGSRWQATVSHRLRRHIRRRVQRCRQPRKTRSKGRATSWPSRSARTPSSEVLFASSCWRKGWLSAARSRCERSGWQFKMYYEYSEPAKVIPSHRMLAIRRGAEEEVLYFQIELDPQTALVSACQNHPGRGRLGAAPETGDGGCVETSAQPVAANRSAAGVEGTLGCRSNSGVPRESAECIVSASGRHDRCSGRRSRPAYWLQGGHRG